MTSLFLEWRELVGKAIYNRKSERSGNRRANQGNRVNRSRSKGATGMVRLIKLGLVLVVLGFVGLTGYAYLIDLSPEPREITLPLTLHAD